MILARAKFCVLDDYKFSIKCYIIMIKTPQYTKTYAEAKATSKLRAL